MLRPSEEPRAALFADLRRGRYRRGPGALSQQRLDRRPAHRAADRRRGAGLPRLGDDAARPAHRHRAGARPCRHRREACHQRRDGGLPAHAFPGRPHRVDGDDAGRLPDARRHGQHRRLRRAGGAERADPARARRQRRLQCAGQQRSRDGRDRPRHPALPDKPDGRAAGRHRPLDPGPSRQVQLLRGRGRGGHDLAVARRAARHPERGLGGHGDGGGRAAPDHERVDDQARRNPRDLRRRDARQPAALFDPSRQLRADHSQAAARAPAGGEVEQDRHRQLRP